MMPALFILSQAMAGLLSCKHEWESQCGIQKGIMAVSWVYGNWMEQQESQVKAMIGTAVAARCSYVHLCTHESPWPLGDINMHMEVSWSWPLGIAKTHPHQV